MPVVTDHDAAAMGSGAPFMLAPPFRFAVPSVRPLSDPVTGDEVGSLAPGEWFLAVASHERGFLAASTMWRAAPSRTW
ncbi:hypothetical protein [Embleya sp. NPDC059259]|uniref:hypothetical protein n=1 Tax=unclassified Embleya TaxID=2699296 RepID=UPI0036821C7C